MQFRQLILVASALVTGVASPSLAQGLPAPIVGDSVLQSLVAEALTRNPTVAQRQAAVRAATLRIRPAGTLPDPMLEVGTIDPFQQFHGFSQIQFEVVQEIPWPGLLGAHASLARAVETQARAGVVAARREVTTAVAAAYYRLRYLVAALRTIADQRGLLEAAAQLSMTRYATGAAPQSDPLQAKLARDRLDGEGLALGCRHGGSSPHRRGSRGARTGGTSGAGGASPGPSRLLSTVRLSAQRERPGLQGPGLSVGFFRRATLRVGLAQAEPAGGRRARGLHGCCRGVSRHGGPTATSSRRDGRAGRGVSAAARTPGRWYPARCPGHSRIRPAKLSGRSRRFLTLLSVEDA